MKIKKPILIIIITLFTLCLTGCDAPINISTLGTYLKVKDANNRNCDATPMQVMLDAQVVSGLKSMKNAYANLNIDITPENSNLNIPLNDYIDIMESWYYSLSNNPAIGSLAEGRTKTSYGTTVAESCYLDENYKARLLDATSQSIAATLATKIAHLNVASEEEDYYIPNIPTAILNNDDINTALTLMGYDLTKCEMVVLYTKSNDSTNASFKELNKIGQASFIINNNGPTTTTNCGLMRKYLSNNDSAWTGMFGAGLDKAGRQIYDLNPSMSVSANKRVCNIDESKLFTTHGIQARGVSVDFSIAGGVPDISGIRELLDSNKKWRDNAFSEKRNIAYHITSSLAENIFDGRIVSYRNYDSNHLSMTYMPMYRGAGTSSDATSTITNQGVDYWIPIGYFNHIESSNDDNNLHIRNGVDFVIGVHFRYTYYSDKFHFDISTLISSGNQYSVKAFSPVPPADKIEQICKKVGNQDVQAFTKYSNMTLPTLGKMLETLHNVSEARVVVLKEKLSNAHIPKAPESLTFGPNSDFEVLKSGSADVVVNLLNGLTTETAAVENKHYRLCVGDIDIGGIKVQKLKDNITCSTNSYISDQTGTTGASRTQTYKYYIQNNKTYILFGFYDVGLVDKFTATSNDSDYIYKYSAYNSGLSYNVFDEQIYSYGTATSNYAPVKFSNTGGAQLPLGQVRTDLSVVTGNGCSRTDNNTARKYINKDLKSSAGHAVGIMIGSRKSPLMLNTYLEALYLPGLYADEDFICLGRKVKLSNSWFDGTAINGSTNAFSIINPDTSTSTEITHKATELVSAKLEKIAVGETYNKHGEPQGDGIIYEGIARLRQKNAENIYRSGELGKTLATVNQLFVDEIYTGEFKTRNKSVTESNVGSASMPVFAKAEQGKKDIPRMFVICTATNVDSSLLAYLKDETGTFRQWTSWLHSNGYPKYLPDDTDFDKLIQTIVTKIETTYDITLSDDKNSAGVHIDREKIDKLEQWVDRITEEKKNSIFKVLIRIIGIIIFLYSVAIIFCYVVDVAVAGEGQGLLYVITCHRMRSVSGVSRKERAQMSTQSEHGTYTVRAVSFIDLIPALFIFFTLGILLMTGLYVGAIAKLTDIANQVTSVFRDAIGK